MHIDPQNHSFGLETHRRRCQAVNARCLLKRPVHPRLSCLLPLLFFVVMVYAPFSCAVHSSGKFEIRRERFITQFSVFLWACLDSIPSVAALGFEVIEYPPLPCDYDEYIGSAESFTEPCTEEALEHPLCHRTSLVRQVGSMIQHMRMLVVAPAPRAWCFRAPAQHPAICAWIHREW